MPDYDPAAWAIRCTKAAGIREAAALLIGDDPLFDSDHDNALVAARLIKLAERMERRDA